MPPSAPSAPSLGAHRWLFLNFLARELRNRYLGTVSGLFWSVLHPLLYLAIYAFVFTQVFRVRLPALPEGGYVAFVAVGLWPWIAAQDGLVRATLAVTAQASLIRKVAFPHALLVFSAVAASFLVHALGYVIVLAVLAAIGQPIRLAGLPWALVLWVALYAAACGIGLVLAAWQVFVRDTEHVLAPVLAVAFYATPILYPVSLVPESIRPWLAANPFTPVVERLRALLLGGDLAPVPGDALLFVVAVLLLAAGLWFFRRLSPWFEDFL